MVKHLTGEVGMPLLLVPYGLWRLVVRGDHSWDAIVLTVGPLATFGSVILYCVAMRGRAPWPSWLALLVSKGALLFAWPFVIYLFFYKGLWSLLQLPQQFSALGLLAAGFYVWLGYDPLKALSVLQRKDVVEALAQSSAADPAG